MAVGKGLHVRPLPKSSLQPQFAEMQPHCFCLGSTLLSLVPWAAPMGNQTRKCRTEELEVMWALCSPVKETHSTVTAVEGLLH